jgi:hypothetical protein
MCRSLRWQTEFVYPESAVALSDGRSPAEPVPNEWTCRLSSSVSRDPPTGLLAIISLQLDDIATLIVQVRASNINPSDDDLPYGMLSDFLVKLGEDADYMYNGSPWDPNLPMQAHRNSSKRIAKPMGAPAVQSAAAYAACEVS